MALSGNEYVDSPVHPALLPKNLFGSAIRFQSNYSMFHRCPAFLSNYLYDTSRILLPASV